MVAAREGENQRGFSGIRDEVMGVTLALFAEPVHGAVIIAGQQQQAETVLAKKKSKPRFTARNSDRHDLYQRSVQAPEFEVYFFDKTFRKLRKRCPYSMREDFCGTALLCAEWVDSHRERTALGVDLDPEVLEWGIENNLMPVGEPGNRVDLQRRDVRKVTREKFDLINAMNFSYWILQERREMLRYFRSVRKSLKEDGIFFLDMYGGWESQEPMEEKRKIEGGFTYVWDQHSFDPMTNEAVNYIHFRFRDGSEMKRAFKYVWRCWSMVEIRELLYEAGFRKLHIYWDVADGSFRERKKLNNQPGWLAYIAALV